MPETDHNELRRQLADNWVKSQPNVEAYIFSAIRSFADAEDVIQNVAQQAALHFEKYNPQRPFLPWVLQIAKAQVARHYDKRQREPVVLDSQMLDELARLQTKLPHSRSEEAEALYTCLGHVQKRARDLLRLRYESDMKPGQIAEMLGTSSGSIRVILNRIRTALAKCIKERLAAETT